MRKAGYLTIILLSLAVTGSALAKQEPYLIQHKQEQWGEQRADKALVYIIRPATMGFAIKMWAFADQEFLGLTKGKNYTYAYFVPGEHVFWSKAENVNAIRMRVDAGKTYYIQQHVRVGAWKASVELEILGEAEAKKLLDKCKYVTFTERASAKAGKYIERGYREAQQAASTFPGSKFGETFSFDK